MKLETFIPAEKLRPFVKCYIIVECNATTINTMFPDTALTLGFRYKGKTQYITDAENNLPFAVVAGLRKSIQRMKDHTDTGNVLVVFHTSAAAAFFKEPLYAMFGEVVSLNEFSNFQSLNQMEDKLCSADSNRERIRIVENFLCAQLKDYKPDSLVDGAISIIKSQHGNIRMKDLADKLYISQDAFEKRFRKATGASPKQFSYIVRMHSVIGSLKQKTLSQAAFDAGYYDQAHFSKDFKLFTGETPSDFLKKNQ